MKTQFRITQCSECQGRYELVPPADPRYTIPREKPTSDDYIKRVYECDEEHHLNTIYWEQAAFVMVSLKYRTEELRNRDRSSYLGKTAGNVTRA